MAHAGTALTPKPVQIVAGDAVLNADLTVPDDARGLVIFAHGSGSSRHSGRNRAVGLALLHAHFVTLLLDLLTQGEEPVDVHTAVFPFDIPLLRRRVALAADWTHAGPRTAQLPIVIFTG